MLDAAESATRASLNQSAVAAFSAFDHAGPNNFFKEYPQALPDDFLNTNTGALQQFIATR